MLLSQLAKGIGTLHGGDVTLSSIEYDSRKVKEGSLFCCIVGTFFDGHAYAKSAIENGAAALVVERELDFDVPQLVVENSRIAMAKMSAEWFNHPEKELRIVGVTGTNGKTTTTYMIKSVMERAGIKTGLIGTIRNMIGDKTIEAEHTTPESVDLYKLLRNMADEGVNTVVMEVSSHALHQNRVHGLRFAVGVFTNLTQDHLDYHKTFENYFMAKKILLTMSDEAIINIDDAYANDMKDGLTIPVTTFGIRENADVYASDIDITTRGVQFDLKSEGLTTRLNVPIPGLFSVFNAMGAIATCFRLGVHIGEIKAGLEDMQTVSGRLEPLPTNGRDFSVFVDYAHTPDALENILKTIRDFAKGRIITVFGCGGDRDKAKRPIMGEVAGRYSDMLVITSDNPRTEDPFLILEAIEEGAKKSGCSYEVIEARKDAVDRALHLAKTNDVVVIAGKGHENYQEINGVKHHFDDKEIVASLLEQL